MRARPELLCACLLVASCDTNDPPTLESFEIWDGQPGSAGAALVQPGADGSLTLRLDRIYTGRARVRTGGRADRCLYRIFSYTWNPPSREFNCTLETAPRQTIDEPIATWRGDVARVSEHRLTVSLAEYDVDSRSELNHDTPIGFSVSFQP